MLRVALAALVLSLALVAPAARASVSIAVTWESLLRESTAAALVTPVETRSVWENGRIYTYARVHLDRPVSGDLGPTSDGCVWVRTMGGVVGKIGQLVEGEPVLAPGQQSLLFLHPGPVGAFEVTARGQGQFPVSPGEKVRTRLVRNTGVGVLVPPHGTASRLAADVVHGRALDDVVREVVEAWGPTHGR